MREELWHGPCRAMRFRAALLAAGLLWLMIGRAGAQGPDAQPPGGRPGSLPDAQGPINQPPGSASDTGGAGSPSGPAVQLTDGNSLPLKSPPADPPPPPPLHNLPP